MSMETYSLEVAEMGDGEGITADVYDEDGTITESTGISYGDYELLAEREEDAAPEPVTREVTADVRSLDLQLQRREREFTFRLLGDAEELTRVTVTDTDWQLVHADEAE